MPEGQESDREHAADDDRPPDHSQRSRMRAVGVACAEHPADDHLAGDRDRVEEQREEDEELERDLVCADLRVAHTRKHRRRDEERRIQSRRAHEDLPADPHHRPHLAHARPPRAGSGEEEVARERDAHPSLRDRRAGGRAGDAPVEAVHEHDLEDDVHDVGRDDNL